MRKAATASEAFFFTAVVLADIWFLHFKSRWGDALPAALVVASFVFHQETVSSLGLSWGGAKRALYAWRFITGALVALAIGTLIVLANHPFYLLYRGLRYFVWCVVQQMLLQNMIYRRLRAGFGATWGTSLLAGALFAAAHLPNPVLVPATLAWGAVSARLFERWPSVIAIALLQTLLSGLLYWIAPLRLSHEFRVGPGYYW